MEDILFLTHTTSLDNLKSIFKTGKLMTPLERFESKIDSVGIFYEQRIDLKKKKYSFLKYQFPGVYLDVLTKNMVGDPLFPFCLVFPKDLLEKQKNWHLNLRDQNGYINQNTFTFFTRHLIPRFSETEKWFKQNECVFHDGLPIDLAQIWVKDEKLKKKVLEVLGNTKKNVVVKVVKKVPDKPVLSLPNQEKFFDTTKRPVLSYHLDFYYTGIPSPLFLTHRKKTPMYVYRMLARNAGVKNVQNKSKEELDNEIGKKLHWLFETRPTPVYLPPFVFK